MEELELYLEEAKDLMSKALNHVAHELTKIRAGKANPSMLDGILVSYYGAMSPINQVSSMTAPDARTIMIKPWEKSLIHEIERGRAPLEPDDARHDVLRLCGRLSGHPRCEERDGSDPCAMHGGPR